jgi:hypothetical protein
VDCIRATSYQFIHHLAMVATRVGLASGGAIKAHPPSGTRIPGSLRCQAVDCFRATSYQLIHHLVAFLR